jgi:hypothetical protein
MLCDRCHQREVAVMNFAPNSAEPEKPIRENYCTQCASEVYGTPLPAHRFSAHFRQRSDPVLRVSFVHGDVFRLRGFSTVDPSVEGFADQWTATVVEPVAGKHPDFKRLFHPDSGVQFIESDISEIVDDSSGTVLFRCNVT